MMRPIFGWCMASVHRILFYRVSIINSEYVINRSLHARSHLLYCQLYGINIVSNLCARIIAVHLSNAVIALFILVRFHQLGALYQPWQGGNNFKGGRLINLVVCGAI